MDSLLQAKTLLHDHLYQQYLSAHEAFIALDTDRSGRLSKSEIKRALAMYNMNLSDKIDMLFQILDVSSDGKLSYQEFCDEYFGIRQKRTLHEKDFLKNTPTKSINDENSTSDVNTTVSQLSNRLKQHYGSAHEAFIALDVDRCGKLTKSEIKRVLQLFNLDTSKFEEVFKQLDTNSSGTLNYKEFCAEYFK